MEKLVVDAELLRQWAGNLEAEAFTSPISRSTPFAMGAGRPFLRSDHTIARYETAFYRRCCPIRQLREIWLDSGGKTAPTVLRDLEIGTRGYVAPRCRGRG